MNVQSLLPLRQRSWLMQSVLEPAMEGYVAYLGCSGYASASILAYVRCVAHFAHWLNRRGVPLLRVDEKLVHRFLIDHLPRCRCSGPVRRARHEVRAALHRLMFVLRSQRRIPAAVDPDPIPIRNELRAFARHLDEVCGLASATRAQRVKIIRRFLVDRFKAAPIDLNKLRPRDIHAFVVEASKGCKPSSANVLAGILRSYFRFRSMCGNNVTSLIAAVPRAACWRLAAVPPMPSVDDLNALLSAFDRHSAMGRRNFAIAAHRQAAGRPGVVRH